MARNVSGHIGGSKGALFTERLKSSTLESTLIVPIEVGKRSHKALLADYFGSIFKDPFAFHSSEEGIRFLDHSISKVCVEHQMENVFIGMEATGHYYKKPAESMYQLGYSNLFILNPVTTAQCRKAGLTWSKTDDIDLRAIGQALHNGYGTPYRPQQSLWEDLREICRYRRFQVKYQTAIKNRIHCMLDQLLPGITDVTMFRDAHLWHPASIAFFTKYPNVECIARLRPHNILHFFRRRGRRLAPEDAHQLIRWTQQTFTQTNPAHPTQQEILQSLLEHLNHLAQQISQLEIKLLGYLVQIPAVVLLSIDYLGPLRAGEFVGEITPFDQYPKSRALIKAAGLDPTRSQSSTRESSEHPISKKGSSKLRYITIEIADCLMRHNDYFAAFAERLMERGKSKDCACVATASRFIRVAFSMLQDQQSFHPPNGLGISKDPLRKIELFLRQRQASDRIEAYVNLANTYLQPTAGKGGQTAPSLS